MFLATFYYTVATIWIIPNYPYMLPLAVQELPGDSSEIIGTIYSRHCNVIGHVGPLSELNSMTKSVITSAHTSCLEAVCCHFLGKLARICSPKNNPEMVSWADTRFIHYTSQIN